MEANFHDKNPRKSLGRNSFYTRTKYDHYGKKTEFSRLFIRTAISVRPGCVQKSGTCSVDRISHRMKIELTKNVIPFASGLQF
jgi:hypothetical protein